MSKLKLLNKISTYFTLWNDWFQYGDISKGIKTIAYMQIYVIKINIHNYERLFIMYEHHYAAGADKLSTIHSKSCTKHTTFELELSFLNYKH